MKIQIKDAETILSKHLGLEVSIEEHIEITGSPIKSELKPFLTVTSDGTTGKEWIKRLEDKGFRVGSYAKSILLSKDFKPTKGVTTELVLVKPADISGQLITSNIRSYAEGLGLKAPNAEVACLLRENFSDEQIKELEFWYIVTMHNHIKDSDGDPSLLGVSRYDDGRWLYSRYDRPDDEWGDYGAFVFVLSQVSSGS